MNSEPIRKLQDQGARRKLYGQYRDDEATQRLEFSDRLCVVIGGSAGSNEVLEIICKKIPESFSSTIVVCQHVHPSLITSLRRPFALQTKHTIREPEDKEPLQSSVIYLAPPNYHLLIERDRSFSFSVDQPIYYARPSIDVLFESAALAFGENLIGVLLTGANEDGALGLKKIKECRGMTVVQDPKTAAHSEMPEGALRVMTPDFSLEPIKIAELLCDKFLGGIYDR